MYESIFFMTIGALVVVGVVGSLYVYVIEGCRRKKVEADAIVLHKKGVMTGLFFKGASFNECRSEKVEEVHFSKGGDFARPTTAEEAANRILNVINAHYLHPDIDSIESYLPFEATIVDGYRSGEVLILDGMVGANTPFNSRVALELMALIHRKIP
jgi:hypothetical protein